MALVRHRDLSRWYQVIDLGPSVADCKQHPGALPSTAPTSHSSCLLCVKWSKQTVDIQFPGLISCDSVPRAYMWLWAAILDGRGQNVLTL